MSELVAGVTAMVRRMAPDHSTRWSDDRIKRAIHLADMEVREEGEVEWASEVITLVEDAYYYDIPEDVVQIRSVEFLRDGLTHDYMLQAISLPDLDNVSLTWRQDTSAAPRLFSVMSTPGTRRYSRIVLYPAMSTATGEAVRVNYVKVRAAASDLSSVEMPDEIQRSVYLPRALSHLIADENVPEAQMYLDEFYRKLDAVRARYGNRTNWSVE